MSGTPRHPMKRKLFGLLCGLPWLSACSSTIKDWSEMPHATAPFYRGQPTTVETRTVSTMSGAAVETRYLAGYRSFDREDTYQASWRMVKRALALGLIAGREEVNESTGRTYLDLEVLGDKRAFLVSLKPDILLLVPWRFKMDDLYMGTDGKPYLHSRSYEKQLIELHKQYEIFGLSYSVQGIRWLGRGGWAIIVELSPVFPDEEGIQAISDKWQGVRSLAEMDADTALPFKTEPAPGMPGFRRLVLR